MIRFNEKYLFLNDYKFKASNNEFNFFFLKKFHNPQTAITNILFFLKKGNNVTVVVDVSFGEKFIIFFW